MSDPTQPWYSNAELKRDRQHVLQSPHEVASQSTSKFVVVQGSKGMYHQIGDEKDDRCETQALFFQYEQMEKIMDMKDALNGEGENLVAWVGEYDGSNYFVCHVQGEIPTLEEYAKTNIRVSSLRNFGDRLMSPMESAILATCNGLVEFHKSHPFCSKCGSKTKPFKVGASRKCTSCKTSVYPRIDVAAIMLITSACGQYALLGRKAIWPQGRYSTLAGFCEVGETLEQCCAREVKEESGIDVSLESIRFVCSQPWPFPRSLMAGFRGVAIQSGDELPVIHVDENELEDVQWFHIDYVRERLEGGSTSLTFEPNEREKEFHVPGPSSLARLLITQWAEKS